MYCPKCGTQNPDNAMFCSSCGDPLGQAAAPAAAPMPSQAPAGQKSAPLAAILNLFWGLGYLYLGYHKVAGLPAIAFVILMIIVYFVVGIFTIGILTLVIAIVLAVDGWKKGKGQNGFIGAQR